MIFYFLHNRDTGKKKKGRLITWVKPVFFEKILESEFFEVIN